MDMMHYLKISFVILLCLPILYFGAVFMSKLMDNMISGIRQRKAK
jgi:hypothetical protein